MFKTTSQTSLTPRNNLLRTRVDVGILTAVSLSEIIILLKDHVYQPKSGDISLYLIISCLPLPVRVSS